MQSKRRPQQSGARRNQGPRQPAARPAFQSPPPSVIQPLSSTPFKVVDQGRPRNNRNGNNNRNTGNRSNAGKRPNQFVSAPAQRTASAVNLITTPPRQRPSQSQSRAPQPAVNVNNDGRNIGRCPGDSLEGCIDVCPSFSARIFGACVAGCARRCPE